MSPNIHSLQVSDIFCLLKEVQNEEPNNSFFIADIKSKNNMLAEINDL